MVGLVFLVNILQQEVKYLASPIHKCQPLSLEKVLMFRVLHSQHSALAEGREGVRAANGGDDLPGGKEKFLEGLCRKAKHTGSFKLK